MSIAPEDRDFWRGLVAPFPDSAYLERPGKGNMTFTYLDARTIMNRLDDVCGPDHWFLEYRADNGGVVCRLSVRSPMGELVFREGGGSFRDMQDQDSSFKSGFTSAFRVAAANLGIGRDLYQMGMPEYCADMFEGRHVKPTRKSAAPSSNGNSNGQQRPAYDRRDETGPGKPPFGKAGTKAPYAWAMKCSDHYGVKVLDHMIAYAKKKGQGTRTDQWDEAFLDDCLNKAVEWIKSLDSYDGAFGDAQPKEHFDTNASKSKMQEINDSACKKKQESVVDLAKTVLCNQMGREPSGAELIDIISASAAAVANGLGHRGAVLQSLRDCRDLAWLTHIEDHLAKMASSAVQDDGDDNGCPF